MKKLPNFGRSSINILKVNLSGPVIVTVPVATAQVGLLSRQLLRTGAGALIVTP
jgi:hypothetical protein